MELIRAINQLRSLRMHCESMIDKDEPGSVWHDDVEALDSALIAMNGVWLMTRLEGGEDND